MLEKPKHPDFNKAIQARNRAALAGYVIAGGTAILLVVAKALHLVTLTEAIIANAIIIISLIGTGWLAHLRDREARQSLSDLEDKHRLLLLTEECANVGHWRLNFADDNLFWSDQTFNIHGVRKGQPPDLEGAINAFHPDDRSLVQKAISRARETGTPYEFSARIVRPSGEIRNTESVARVEYDRDGNAVAVFGIFSDRTDEVQMREELIKARDEAEAAGAAKATFLARMSHEIRTPMNGIIGFADLLLSEDLPDHQRRQVELIVESGKALTLILNDILDLSKIDAGQLMIQSDCVDLPSLVGRCAQMIEPQIREKGLAFELEIAPDVPRNFAGDPLRLRQILSNLLHNAVKFTDRGQIELSVWTEVDQVCVEVSDTGIGIPEEVQNLIFDAFTQAEDAATNSIGGTGLGLAISLQLAHLMGGELTVSSSKGMGSSFLLKLPLHYTGVTSKAAKSQTIEVDTSGKRILLAEDYDINQLLVASMAKKAGFNLDVAEDGMEAIARVNAAAQQGQPYSLVLMDLQMPKLDGMGATRRLREAGFGPKQLPILALSANAFPEDVDASLEAGMQGHIAKPMTYETFFTEVHKWLNLQPIEA